MFWKKPTPKPNPFEEGQRRAERAADWQRQQLQHLRRAFQHFQDRYPELFAAAVFKSECLNNDATYRVTSDTLEPELSTLWSCGDASLSVSVTLLSTSSGTGELVSGKISGQGVSPRATFNGYLNLGNGDDLARSMGSFYLVVGLRRA